MRNFYTALQTYFNKQTAGVHNDFWNDIGGRFYHGQAEIPEAAEYPYCVISHVANTQVDTFKSKLDEILMQFSIFSDNHSAAEIHDAMTHLKTLFSDCTFTIPGATLIQFFWTSDGLMREEVATQGGVTEIWHFHCDFIAILERA